MIIKTEIAHIRKYMTDIILSALADNRKYVSTYYKHKKYPNDPIDGRQEAVDIYEDLINFSFFSESGNYITDLYLKKEVLKFGYTDYINGSDHEDFVDILPVEVLYLIIKWLQRHNFLDNIIHIKYCYFCGKTRLQKLAWVDANSDNKFIEFYDQYDNNVFCDKCQRNASYLEYDNTNVPIELVEKWYSIASIEVLEAITGLSTKAFKNDKDHSDFQLKCYEFWKTLKDKVKRNIWIRFRDI